MFVRGLRKNPSISYEIECYDFFRLQILTDYGTIFIMLFAFCFPPAHLVSYTIGERLREEKQVQRVMGVDLLTYWAAVIVWDLAVSLTKFFVTTVTFLFSCITGYIYPRPKSSA